MSERLPVRCAMVAALVVLACACEPAGSGAPAGASASGAPGASGASANGPGATGTDVAPAPPLGREERWSEVVSEGAPLLQSVDDPLSSPPDFIRRGELVRVGKGRKKADWKGAILGEQVTREGMTFEVQRANGGSRTFAFESDLGGEVVLSATGALCDALGKRAPFELKACKSSLRRAKVADGAIASFVICGSGPCPVALERDGKLTAIAVQNLTNAHFVTGKKKSVLVGETRFVKAEGKHTSGSVVVIALDGDTPVRAADYPADDVDATSPDHVLARVVSVTVSGSEIRIQGRIEDRKTDGTELSKKAIDEVHALPALD